MTCTQARRGFDAYWDDEITQAERERLEAHFASCESCRREYEEYARVLESVATLPRHEAAPGFVERTLVRARRASTVPDLVAAPRPWWIPATAALALLAIVSALLFSGHLGPNPPAVAVRAPAMPQAVPVATPGSGPAGAAAIVTGGSARPVAVTPALLDSLIDHSEDVQFVLDPVRVSHGRTAANRGLGPRHGPKTLITF